MELDLTGHKQANVSRHLGLLDRAGVVTRRVEGNHVFYDVADESMPKLCQVIKDSIQSHQASVNAVVTDD